MSQRLISGVKARNKQGCTRLVVTTHTSVLEAINQDFATVVAFNDIKQLVATIKTTGEANRPLEIKFDCGEHGTAIIAPPCAHRCG